MAYDPRSYQREKLKRQYFRARWDCYFETGELLPVDWWKKVWERRKKTMDEQRRAANDEN